MGLFAQLDVNWPDNEKVIAVGLAGAGLHATAIALAKRTETDGVLSRALLIRHGATPELIDLLIDERLFDHVDDRRIAVHGWLDRNPSVSDYQASARAGNHKRWKHPGPVDTCPRCNPDLAPRSPGDRPPIGGDSEATDPDPTPDPVENDPPPVDNPSNGEHPSSIAIDRPPIAPDSPPDSPRSRPRVLEQSRDRVETTPDRTSRARTAPDHDPTEADTFTAALHLLAAREILTNAAHTDSAKQRAAIVGSKRRIHATAAHKHLRKHPDATPQQLADHLEPPPDTRPPAVPTSPWSGDSEIARRADVETEEATAARLAALRASTTQADATAALATARAALHPPTEPQPPDPTQPDAGPTSDRTE